MPLANTEICLFFDDGNVLNDNTIREKQWQNLVGNYFSPIFGGEPKIWGDANAQIIKDFKSKGVPQLIHINRQKSHHEFMEMFIEKWINEMFDFAGVERPNKTQYKRIYYEAAHFVNLRIKAAFPGVIDTIKMLYHKGFNLYTASGTESIELQYYLEGMGIKPFFKKFYGPDLINILKVDDAFYKAILKDLEIKPNQTIFIEDKPYYLNIAENLGANVIQACLTGEIKPQFPYVVTNMKNLPKIIEQVIDKGKKKL